MFVVLVRITQMLGSVSQVVYIDGVPSETNHFLSGRIGGGLELWQGLFQ